MSVDVFNLLSYLKSKVVPQLLELTLGKANQCGLQNKANRHAWLKNTLAGIPPGQRILDAGAGEQQYKRFCAHLDYVSQDFARYDGRGDGAGLQKGIWDQSHLDIVCDITSIPEPDGSFDVTMCIEVLEHLPDPIRALGELARLLKRGGMLIVTAPFCSLTHFSPYFYYTGYSRYFYEYWLSELGFHIEDMQWNGNYFEYLAQELRRLPSSGKKYSRISPSWFERGAMHIILRLLRRLSRHDQGSQKLLAYGLHIRARKK